RIPTNGNAIGSTTGGLLVRTPQGVVLQHIGTAGTGTSTPRALVPPDATVVAVHRDRVAWVRNECGVLRCPVHVTEIASGMSSSWMQLVGHPSGRSVTDASARFSSDG